MTSNFFGAFMVLMLVMSPSLVFSSDITPPPQRGLDQEAVRQVIGRSLSDIKTCYDDQLKTKPHLAGKLVVKIIVDDQGKVRESSVKSRTFDDAQVEACVLAQLAQRKFPPPPQGKTGEINYPFVFEKQK